MIDLEFVDIEKLDPSILIDVRYATINNFTKEVLYSLPKCFLRRKVAQKLVKVQEKLQVRGLGLKVYDAYRPHSVQKRLWEVFPNPTFVADPALGSKHSLGASVDVTLVDREGNELLMPTPFDDFNEKAYRSCQDLPAEAIVNRHLLEEAMQEQGFLPLPSEWWHFDDEEWDKYPLEDLSLEELKGVCNVL